MTPPETQLRGRRRARGPGRRCVGLVAGATASAALCLAGDALADDLPWEVWNDPALIATLDAADVVLEQSSHCLDGCRFDRSNQGFESTADNPFPERWLYRDGGEVTVFDQHGPGAITRIWMTTGFGHSTCIDPSTRVRFYLDGTSAPTLDLPLAALFDGSTPPFAAPLVADAAQSSGGYVSYVPIAFASALRIALVNAENGGSNTCNPAGPPGQRLLWFQFQYHRLTPSTPVASFTPQVDLSAWRAFLAHAGDDPWQSNLKPIIASGVLAAGATLTLADRVGPGWLRGIRLRLPAAAYANVALRIAFDGATRIDLPLADFFATSAQATSAARGVLVGRDNDGWLYAWFPMPFRTDARVDLVASADSQGMVTIDSALSFDAAPMPDNAGTFNATLHDACGDTGTLTLYDDHGAGKVVGISARYDANGSGSLGYLEGDERAAIDGASAPAWYGTGIEDFYNGGFYFDAGAYTNALSGATEVDTTGSGVTAAYRLMPTDAVTYTSALRLTQEAGFSSAMPVPTCLRSVAYVYTRANASMVAYDAFDVGDIALADAHDYSAPAGAQCVARNGSFEDEATTPRAAVTCRYASGASHFRFHLDADARGPFRLRRTFDVAAGAPGSVAGSAGARVFVNGIEAGYFAPAIANPAHVWQQQEALLDVEASAGDIDVDVLPDFAAATPTFSESAWQLRGGFKDSIFADGFEP